MKLFHPNIGLGAILLKIERHWNNCKLCFSVNFAINVAHKLIRVL